MDWISVKDRLPDERRRCLIYGEKHIGIGNYVEPFWYEDEWDRGYGCPEITHWMPLPKPPKEEEK